VCTGGCDNAVVQIATCKEKRAALFILKSNSNYSNIHGSSTIERQNDTATLINKKSPDPEGI
jgi:hypothetical protein